MEEESKNDTIKDEARPNIDLVCLIDRSGSMSGNKMN